MSPLRELPARVRLLLRRCLCSRSEARWDALDALAKSHRQHGAVRSWLATLVEAAEGVGDDDRLRRSRARRRRRAAIALLRICRNSRAGVAPDDARLQAALARGLALALPRRLSRPNVAHSVLPPAECEALAREAKCVGAQNGWGSLHRKYSTHDMPVERLASGPRLLERLRATLLPEFPKRFGARFGPEAALRFINLFVVRYTASKADGQQGLDGHVDESLVRRDHAWHSAWWHRAPARPP